MSKPTGLTYLQAMNPLSHDHFARDAFGLVLGVGAFYLAGSKKYVAPLNLSKVLTAGAIAFGGLEVYKNFLEASVGQKSKDAKVRYTAALTYIVVIGLGVRVLSKPGLASKKARIPERFHITFGKEILYAAGAGLAGALALSLLGRPTLKETYDELNKMNQKEIHKVINQLNKNKIKIAYLDQLVAILWNSRVKETVTAVPGLTFETFFLASQEDINFIIYAINDGRLTAPEAIAGAILNRNATEKLGKGKAYQISKEFLKGLSSIQAKLLLTKYSFDNQLFTQDQVLALAQVKGVKKDVINSAIEKIPAKQMKKISAEEFEVIKRRLLQEETPLKLTKEQWNNLVENEKINKSNAAIWMINNLPENVAQEVAKQPETFELTAQQVIELLKHKGISSKNPVDISKHEKVFDEQAFQKLSKDQADALAKAYGTKKEDQKLVMTKKQHTALGQNEYLSEKVLSEWREKKSVDSDD